MKLYFVVVVALFWSVMSYGQTYSNLYFEQVNNNDGLISDEVNVSHQDAKGFMWFATSEGLVRYDGYEFRSYKNHPHLGFLYGTEVTCIESGDDGQLFVGTGNGFYAFSENMEPIYEYASKVINHYVNDIYNASDGKIYLGSYQGFYIIDPSKEEVYTVRDANVKNNFSRHIVEDRKGRIWVGSWNNGLLRLNDDNKTFTQYSLSEGLNNDHVNRSVRSLFVDSKGFMWVGTWRSGLFVLDINTNTEPELIKVFEHDIADENTIPGNMIFDIEEDKFNGIWIGTPYGASLIRYPLTNNSKVTRYDYGTEEGAISSNVIWDIYRDRSNLLWFATKGGGINKLHIERNKFDHYIIPDLHPQIRTQSVYAFQKDKKDRLMVGVRSQGFVVYNLKDKEFKQFKEFPEFKELNAKVDLNTVKSFLWDNDSVLWLGTRYNGLVGVDPVNGKLQLINSAITKNAFAGREVNVQFLDTDGSLWVGTELGLHHISLGSRLKPKISRVKFFGEDSKIINNVNITGIIKGVKGGILVSTYLNGIFQLKNDNGSYRAVRWSAVGVPYKIVTLFLDEGGRVWIGTKGSGIKYVDKNSNLLKSPLPNINMSGDVVFGIEQDSYGSMWFTTNKGLLKLWFQQGLVRTERFMHREGLQGNIFIARSIFKNENGQLLVGGYNGFNKFNPLKINGNYSSPPIVITDVSIEGVRKEFINNNGEPLILNHEQNDLSISFSALDYIYSNANQYAYKMEGVGKEWSYVNSKMRSIHYSNLLPGKYVFKIKGSNNQGVWNDEYIELPIIVKPAAYKTWWAIVIYIIIIIGVTGFLFYQRLNIERIKQKYQLELIDKNRTEKLNEYKLRFFTNISHELLTPLSILSSVSENSIVKNKFTLNDSLVIQRNVNNLTRMIRQLLTFRKMESGNMSLKLENGDISLFSITKLNDFRTLAEKRSINFDINVTPHISGVFDAEKLEMIFHNLLSNAFKHTGDGGDIYCSVNWDKVDESIQIIIKDNGEGISEQALPNLFNRYDRGDKKVSKGGVGIGLNLTNNIIQLLGGQITVESELNVGSVFTVTLPVSSNSFDENRIGSVDSVDNSAWIDDESNEEVFETKENIPEGDYTILIAEDNDDFRGILHSSLGAYFKVLVAVDGKQALEMAADNEVDLIVSDIMMPNVTGSELCAKVKSDINLSHIPVILLTAKTGYENKLAGYEAGADAYIEKPAVLKLLIVRINNLLKQREKFKQNASSSDVNLEPSNISVTPLDHQFIIDAKALVEKNLSDPEFAVKTMAAELNVSNSMLYRKIRNLVGMPPNEFIRNIRLKRAAQMLHNKSFTISEVAYNCGFNDLGYFGVCFKKQFGKTPTLYQAEDGEVAINKEGGE